MLVTYEKSWRNLGLFVIMLLDKSFILCYNIDMKKYKPVSLSAKFNNEVKRLSLHIQDAGIKDDKSGELINSATIFGTLQLYKSDDKKKVENINFSLPFNDNEDLMNHICSMIEQAVLLSKNKK